MKKIETESLILREMTPEDFDRLYAVLADSGITPIPSAMLKATPHNCVCESQPPFCPTSAVPKMGILRSRCQRKLAYGCGIPLAGTYSIPPFLEL